MKKWFRNFLFSTMCVAVIVGCSSEEDSVVMAPLPVVNNQFTPTEQWDTSIGDGVGQYYSKLQPKFIYDKVFLASRDGKLKALDPKTGKEIWHYDIESDEPVRLSGGIGAGLNQILVGSENGIVYAFNAETGALNWQQDVDGEVLSTPLVDDNLVIVNLSKGALVALEQTTGHIQWVINTELPNLTLRGDSTPLATSGGVFWGTANGQLAAALTSNGQLLWQRPIGTPTGATEIDRLVDVDASPLLLGSTLYIIGYHGQLVAIDLTSAQIVWKRKYTSATSMATDGGRLFVVTDHDHVVAVDARSGTKLWENSQLENRLLTAPMVIHNYLVVGDSQGYLHWISRETGEFVAQQYVDSSGFAVGPIALPNQGYLIETRNGDVEKLTLQ